MTAVVTGAAGFVGRALVAHLQSAGHQVVGVDRRPQPAQDGLVVLTADLLDQDELVTTALATADAVFHLAGCPSVRDASPDIAHRRNRDNVEATARVLSAVPLEVPLVVTSSSSVYGGARGRASRERDRLRPRGGYATSKVLVERLCAARLGAGGIVAVARPFTIVGEGQRPDMALACWLRDARAGRPLRVLGSLERTRDLTDVRQAVRVLALLADRRVCGPVNVGTGRPHTLRAMVDAVGAALGQQVDVRVEPASSVEVPDTRADTGRLRAAVGFVPRTDLYEVVHRQALASAAAEVLG